MQDRKNRRKKLLACDGTRGGRNGDRGDDDDVIGGDVNSQCVGVM